MERRRVTVVSEDDKKQQECLPFLLFRNPHNVVFVFLISSTPLKDMATLTLSVNDRQGRSWAKPNKTLALHLQKFWKKLRRKKPPKIFF